MKDRSLSLLTLILATMLGVLILAGEIRGMKREITSLKQTIERKK